LTDGHAGVQQDGKISEPATNVIFYFCNIFAENIGGTLMIFRVTR
jgi:hypothetical protein